MQMISNIGGSDSTSCTHACDSSTENIEQIAVTSTQDNTGCHTKPWIKLDHPYGEEFLYLYMFCVFYSWDFRGNGF